MAYTEHDERAVYKKVSHKQRYVILESQSHLKNTAEH